MSVKVIYEPNKGLYQVKDQTGGISIEGGRLSAGDISVKKSLNLSIVTKTSNYSIGDESVIFGDASSGKITFTLPNANNLLSGTMKRIKKIDNTNNLLVLSGTTGQNIDGVQAKEFSIPYTSLTLITSGSNWFIL